MMVYVNSDLSQVSDFNNAVINRSDHIIHNPLICQSKLYRITRMIAQTYKESSPSEIARRIMRDDIDTK